MVAVQSAMMTLVLSATVSAFMDILNACIAHWRLSLVTPA